jgi:hypothetical protein
MLHDDDKSLPKTGFAGICVYVFDECIQGGRPGSASRVGPATKLWANP